MKHWILVTLVAAASAACLNGSGASIEGPLTAGNIERLVTDKEVQDHGRNGLKVEHTVLDLKQRAAAEPDVDLSNVDAWYGLEFSESVAGARLSVAIVDLTDPAAANSKFEEVRDEVLLVESDQGIGERFAGLSPQTAGFHTIVLFFVADKVAILTTTQTLTDYTPLVSSEQLVELARLIAPRLTP